MRTATAVSDAANALAAAKHRFDLAENAVLERRAAFDLAVRMAKVSKGLELAAAIETREAAKAALDSAESALTEASAAWNAAVKAEAAAKAAYRRDRAPGARAEAKKIVREIDAHFDAIEKLLDQQAQPLAREIERDLCTTWWSGIVTNSQELGPAPYLAALRGPSHLRDAIAGWRIAIADVQQAK